MFDRQRVVITGGTGSLGNALLRRLLTDGATLGYPSSIVILSRDEAKQHRMRLDMLERPAATDEVIYGEALRRVQFRICDIRDLLSLEEAMDDADVVIHAAAMKQVPTCEYHPLEAIQTNLIGAANVARAALKAHTSKVVFISTDKASAPLNAYGMTKALQERLLVGANLWNGDTQFMGVRYGNVIASRGSVIPLFAEQIRAGGPVTVTSSMMTRFFFTLEDAVQAVLDALRFCNPGQILIPVLPSVRMTDLARVMIDEMSPKPIQITYSGIRPAEKLHETLISVDECRCAYAEVGHFILESLLPEMGHWKHQPIDRPYTSADEPVGQGEIRHLLKAAGVLQ